MVNIEQHVWGMTPEGEAIILYTMRNDSGAEVRLSNYGAAIVSATMPDREGRMADVVLGYKHPEGYFFDGAASGKSVGRCANRIAFGQMTVEGKEYRLEVNNGVNHLHGGTKGFANRIWESRVETNRVVMSLLSEDGDQNYPGELNVEAVFDFDDENALEITYLARTDKTTVVNLTNHVYFNLAGEGSGSVLDHQLRLNSSKVLEMNDKQIPRAGCSTQRARRRTSRIPDRSAPASRRSSTTSAISRGTTTRSSSTAGSPTFWARSANCARPHRAAR